MASTTLYPPIVDSYTAAFISSAGICRVYYSLAKFSSPATDIKAVHFIITKQSSGANVVNKNLDSSRVGKRYARTGILIIEDDIMHPVEGVDNLYYTDIKACGDALTNDIASGWTPGWIYKIQMRFSTVSFYDYIGTEDWDANTLSGWLNHNAGNFSEWSTATLTKAIPQPIITIPTIGYDSSVTPDDNSVETCIVPSSTLTVTGEYYNQDSSEKLYSYNLTLKDLEGQILEQTDIFYPKNSNQLNYIFKIELQASESPAYSLELEYETNNKYKQTLVISLQADYAETPAQDLFLLTAEDADVRAEEVIEREQCDGRVGLRLMSSDSEAQFGNVCIRRADSRTNFTVWSDIAFVNIDKAIDEMPLIYDYTTESGVWYQYGVQTIDSQNRRSQLVKHAPIKREFEYSFLLGQDGRQLRLMLNHTMGSFKTAVSDSKMDTIGGQFSFITRNGNMKYKTFPINGLISFNMDENNLFTSVEKIYGSSEVAALYTGTNDRGYNYTYEREFRTQVVEFLQNGEAKLFKSPTEGNIIVRLMDVNTTPDRKLSRLISSFSANAHEIATADYDNYVKYGFCIPGSPIFAAAVLETRIGQFSLTIPDGETTDIMPLIVDTYSRTGERNVAGVDEEVVSISNVEMLFDDVETSTFSLMRGVRPTYIINSNVTREIKVFNSNYFNCDAVVFPANEPLSVTGTHTILVNFTYTVKSTPTSIKHLTHIMHTTTPGQIARYMTPGSSLMNQISSKYFYDWSNEYSALKEILHATISTKANAVFKLIYRDGVTDDTQIIVDATGVLDLTPYLSSIQDIVYVGKIVDGTDIIANPSLAELKGTLITDNLAGVDIWVDYIVSVEKGVY